MSGLMHSQSAASAQSLPPSQLAQALSFLFVPGNRPERFAKALASGADAVIIDMHCEATSEKMAMGHHCDGRASLVVGSHTHVPTADTMILTGGTAYQTDAGMCGDYDSVIGMQKEGSLYRFQSQLPGERYQPALGEGTLCGTYIETDDRTGLAVKIEPIRIGGRLSPQVPAA
jgi:calcineurin-like phosphoesterase